MAKYEVEFAKFTKVVYEAESLEDAKDKAAMMENDEIDEKTDRFANNNDYIIWNDPTELN